MVLPHLPRPSRLHATTLPKIPSHAISHPYRSLRSRLQPYLTREAPRFRRSVTQRGAVLPSLPRSRTPHAHHHGTTPSREQDRKYSFE
ncbi:hypothetical protein K458DRAFT_177734 [Lentithecium fluviatile CBS 122367]|uniref:Uncharacterized protein n=1 Tax=Lentithecium fluviatile CBS 122367 TaxID=1168545 RepID=A0A6G1IG72_9PLEO|nr:hypothetical protein K458DRAFT_177734 [Lentithecium fluviatile CBS 122367]